MTAETSREMLALAKRIDKARNCDCFDEPFLPEMSLAERDSIVTAFRLAAKPSDEGDKCVKLSLVIEALESAANDARKANISGFDALTSIAILFKRGPSSPTGEPKR